MIPGCRKFNAPAGFPGGSHIQKALAPQGKERTQDDLGVRKRGDEVVRLVLVGLHERHHAEGEARDDLRDQKL